MLRKVEKNDFLENRAKNYGHELYACSGRIEKALNKLPGVNHAVVNLAMERGTVEFNPDEIKIVDIKARIEKLGFGAHDVTNLAEVTKKRKRAKQKNNNNDFALFFPPYFLFPSCLLSVTTRDGQ